MFFKDFNDRPKVQGNWTCSECGASITELPFEPTPGKKIFCKDCWRKQRSDSGFDRKRNTPTEPVRGNWTCSECGASITELPFEPTPGKKIFCKDCWRKQRNNRF